MTTGEPKKKSGWVKWVVIGCSGLTLLCSGLMCSGFFAISSIVKATDPYKEAISRVESSSEAQEALGTPVKPGWFVMGSVSVNNDSGNADLTIPVSGPKGKGTIYLKATRDMSQWNYDRIVLDVKGGSQIDLMSEDDGGGEEEGVEKL